MNYEILILVILFIILNISNILHKENEHFENKKNIVWLYWENKPGKTKPEYLNMCMESISKHLKDYEIIVLNPDNLDKYLKNINPNVHKIKQLAHKADYLRMLATYQHGGFWFDADTIVMDNIDLWNDRLKQYDLVWYGMNAYGVNKHNTFIKNVLDKVDNKINNSKNHNFNWREIGQDIIDPELKTYKKKYPNKFFKLPDTEVCFMPFNQDNQRTGFISKNQRVLKDKYKNTQKIIMLHNQLYPNSFKKMTREEILKDDMVISTLFKKTLN
jgi:hypothetical protein